MKSCPPKGVAEEFHAADKKKAPPKKKGKRGGARMQLEALQGKY